MTYEEVKQIRANPSLTDVDNEELARMIDGAIEKQIPKKPDVKDDGFRCPACNNYVSDWEINGAVYEQLYCDECGQKIDWSDEQ